MHFKDVHFWIYPLTSRLFLTMCQHSRSIVYVSKLNYANKSLLTRRAHKKSSEKILQTPLV